MARWVVSLLPVGLLLVITLVNPTYMKPLFTHSSGRVMIAVGALMTLLGGLLVLAHGSAIAPFIYTVF